MSKEEFPEFPITLTDKAKEFLVKQADLEGLGRKTVRFSLVFGRNREGKGVYRYNVETVHSQDLTCELDNGFTVVVDGNSSPLMQGTIVDVKEGVNEKGEPITGFVFNNPNSAKTPTVSPCQSSAGNCSCSQGGCEKTK